MSFILHTGNDLPRLIEVLADKLREMRETQSDPFAEPLVVVPNQAIGKWLRLKLAEIDGFCPSLEMPYPGAFLYSYLFEPLQTAKGVATQSGETPFEPASVTWRIYRLLPELEKQSTFKRVAHFVSADPLRRWQLASRLAALFDRYMTYRPDLMREWEASKNPITGVDAAWQAQLWQAVIKDSRSSGGAKHFSAHYQDFIEAAKDPAQLAKTLSPLTARKKVFYFGLSNLPPAHLDLLIRLAQNSDLELHFFALNPCRELWHDAKSLKTQLREYATLVEMIGAAAAANYQDTGSSLLGSLGASSRDFFSLLLAYEGIQEEEHFVEPRQPDTLLGTLQWEILNNKVSAEPPVSDPNDRSIEVHACHSAMREIEVLHSYLLHLFKEMPELTCRDVAVYLPDMESYAPYIESVFGAYEPATPGHIPYTIADQSLLHSVELCQAFMRLLDTLGGRFKASEVMGLLQHDAVLRRCKIETDDLPRLMALLKEAGLNWGVDSEFRQEQGGANSATGTWRFALQRLLLGVAMQEPPDNLQPLTIGNHHNYPLASAEGSATAVGALADFVEALIAKRKSIITQPERTAAEWRDLLNAMIEKFFSATAEELGAVLILRRAFERFATLLQAANCLDLQLDFSVVRAWLHTELENTAARENFTTGRVTFARFQPMRNVPARVACLVGMNDGTFPRNTGTLSFDLLESNRTHFSPNTPRAEDRQAFLETVMAARERLAIFYTGHDAKDNKPLPPSVLVNELLDAVDRSAAAAVLTHHHPLHPFNPTYFRPESHLASFSQTWYKVAKKLQEQVAAPPTPDTASPTPTATPTTAVVAGGTPQVVKLDQLIAFYSEPNKYYFEQELDVSLNIRELEQPDDETKIEMNSLDMYSVRAKLLEELTSGQNRVEELRQRWESTGELPQGSAAKFAELLTTAEELVKKKNELVGGKSCTPQELNLSLPGNYLLEGTLPDIYAVDKKNIQLIMRPGKLRGKDRVNGYLRHYAACAAGLNVTTTLIYNPKDTKIDTQQIDQIKTAKAQAKLSELIEFYLKNCHAPRCFDANIGWELIEKEKELAKGKTKKVDLVKAWQGDERSRGVDIYTQKVFGEENPLEDTNLMAEMEKVTELIWGEDATV